MLPDELGLFVFSYLPWQALVACSSVCKRWRTLAEDATLWRNLCRNRHWEWKDRKAHECGDSILEQDYEDTDDEGMGDDEEEDDEDRTVERMLLPSEPSTLTPMEIDTPHHTPRCLQSRLNKPHPPLDEPDYKLLFQTHTTLNRRIARSEYSLSTLQTSGSPNGHNNTIYCLQLYTYPDSGMQVLFTGSKDRTIREWDLTGGAVIRVFDRVHRGSVLSISASNGLLVSGGSDCAVVIWDLETGMHSSPIRHHVDSVLCVRLDHQRLVTCSKGQRSAFRSFKATDIVFSDRTVRTYRLPDFKPEHVLDGHRAAVNAVSVSGQYIASASGDRSMRIWDAETGHLLQKHENHHGRGYAKRFYHRLQGLIFSPQHL